MFTGKEILFATSVTCATCNFPRSTYYMLHAQKTKMKVNDYDSCDNDRGRTLRKEDDS